MQVYQTRLKEALEVAPLGLATILRSLPQQNIVQMGTTTHLIPAGPSIRLSQREAPGAIAVGAVSRLKVLEPVLRYARSVRIYSSDEAVSAFELTFPEGSFTLVLSPSAARGFSGEGQALAGLSQTSACDPLACIKSALQWQDKINTAELSRKLGIDTESVERGLKVLGTRGLVGYDLAAGAFFHRELPFDLELVEDLHPRMKKARELADGKCVRLQRTTNGDNIEAYVKGSKTEHYVRISADGGRCTCDWFARNQGERGPCSHILAAEIAATAEERK